MDIVFQARHTDVLERFRKHATAKLARIEKLDSRATRVDVEVSTERNPRQAGRKERVELTVTARGPAIRAEAAAEDRYAALDLALAKLESRLRRACDRRKARHGAHVTIRPGDVPAAEPADAGAADADDAAPSGGQPEELIPIETQGESPLVVREKFHAAVPMSIDQALFEMELVGHDFFLFTDADAGLPSVVYRRRGYQYGVIRLVEGEAPGRGRHNGQASSAARAAGR